MTSSSLSSGSGHPESAGVSLWRLTVVGIRLMALWIFCSAVGAVPLAAYAVMSLLDGARPGGGQLVLQLAPSAILAAVQMGLGVFLFVVAPRVARWVCREWDSETACVRVVSVSVGQLYRIASFLLGIYVLLQAVRPAVQTAVTMTAARSWGTLLPSDIVPLVEAMVLVLCGVALVFGARGLAKFLESVGYDSEKTSAQHFSLRLLLIIFLGCAAVLALIRALVR